MTDHFEDLIQTIESNAVNNQTTITNVKLWAESWRAERDLDIQHEIDRVKKKVKETPYPEYKGYGKLNNVYKLNEEDGTTEESS